MTSIYGNKVLCERDLKSFGIFKSKYKQKDNTVNLIFIAICLSTIPFAHNIGRISNNIPVIINTKINSFVEIVPAHITNSEYDNIVYTDKDRDIAIIVHDIVPVDYLMGKEVVFTNGISGIVTYEDTASFTVTINSAGLLPGSSGENVFDKNTNGILGRVSGMEKNAEVYCIKI